MKSTYIYIHSLSISALCPEYSLCACDSQWEPAMNTTDLIPAGMVLTINLSGSQSVVYGPPGSIISKLLAALGLQHSMGVPSRCDSLSAALFIFIYSALIWTCSACSALLPWGVCLQKECYSACIHLKPISAASICFHSGKRLQWLCSQRCVDLRPVCARHGREGENQLERLKCLKNH